MRWSLLLAALSLAQPAAAQIVPMPADDNTRLQHVAWYPEEDVLLTVLPDGALTVILYKGETIERVVVAEAAPLDVRVTDGGNSFIVIPQGAVAHGELQVATSQRTYQFLVRTQASPLAALVVQFEDAEAPVTDAFAAEPELTNLWSYRLRGDAAVIPQSIRDDARRTFIAYAPDQPLPAVFAIGPSGEEEVVNGHMRGDLFVIDRVYSELVFRIDDERARAVRNGQPDTAG